MLLAHASFITAAYLAAALVIAMLIAWVRLDYTSQLRRLSALDARRLARCFGRSAVEM